MPARLSQPEFGLLNGYRVVMIGLSVAAPFAGELFAEHGAEVIWIENPKAIDSSRVARRSGPGNRTGATCAACRWTTCMAPDGRSSPG